MPGVKVSFRYTYPGLESISIRFFWRDESCMLKSAGVQKKIAYHPTAHINALQNEGGTYIFPYRAICFPKIPSLFPKFENH